ncbi:hypothetical protein M8J76_011205 [Diaphorina citri]|nr:hypothetical protein M8J76_011205 [Diaphorina citri]
MNKTNILTKEEVPGIMINGEEIKKVNECVYLGQLISCENVVEREVERRIKIGWSKYWAMKKIFKSMKLNKQMKIKALKMCIFPAILYGSQTWAPTKKIYKKLDVTQYKMFRSILNIRRIDKISNITINNIMKMKDLSKEAKKLKWRWVDRSSNVQASPKDIAEYVFWTGDEKSVTSAIEDYMQAGLMTREEAITLLEDIKLYLGDIQDHYEHEKLKHQLKFSRSNEIPQAGLGSFPLNNLKRTTDFENTELNQIRQQLLKSNYNNYNKRTSSQIINNLAQSKYPSYQSKASESSNLYEKFSEEDYEELMEKLKVADLQYTEYSLEDIIYQLAKVMFAQSLSHGNSEAQDALQKFTSFLENEVDQGRISRTLEKKVIDILIASLSDTLNDHPEFLSAARGDNVHPRMSSLYNNGRSGVETSNSRNPLTSRLNPVYPMYSESGNGNPLSAPSQFESPGFSDKTANFDKNPLQSETYSRYFDKTSDFKEKNANLEVEDSGFTDKTLTFDNNPSQYDTNSRYLDKTSDFQQKNVVLLAKDPKFSDKTSSYQNNLGSDRNLGKSWTFSEKSADLAKDPSVLNSEKSSNLGNKDPSLENDLAKETFAVEGPQISRETLRFPVASLLVEKRGVKKTIKRGAGFFADFNSEEEFRRSIMVKPAMKKRNIQSSGILDAASNGGLSMMNKKASLK